MNKATYDSYTMCLENVRGDMVQKIGHKRYGTPWIFWQCQATPLKELAHNPLRTPWISNYCASMFCPHLKIQQVKVTVTPNELNFYKLVLLQLNPLNVITDSVTILLIWSDWPISKYAFMGYFVHISRKCIIDIYWLMLLLYLGTKMITLSWFHCTQIFTSWNNWILNFVTQIVEIL